MPFHPDIRAALLNDHNQGEGAGGAHPPLDDLRFSNTTGILQKKKLCGLLVLK